MKRSILETRVARRLAKALSLVVAISTVHVAPASAEPAPKPVRPNIVFILVDDLGWGDVGYHGSQIRTPNLDRLADKGVQLDRYYTYAVCSPTRAALLSGRSSLETGVDAPIADNHALGSDVTLLPQHLRRAGYRTLLVGKWHLGQRTVRDTPIHRGFDYYYGFLGGYIDHYTHLTRGGRLDWQRNGKSLRETGHSTELIANDAIDQIRRRDKDKPFFLYLAFDAPHSPFQAPQEFVDGYKSIPDERVRVYSAVVSHLDTHIGRVLATLEEQGIDRNTLVVFASDNGGQRGSGSSLPLRGNKGMSLEGGQRVPALAYWPGVVEGGQSIKQSVSVHDWFPTLLKLAGASVPADRRLVGRDAMAALRGRTLAPKPFILGNYSASKQYHESVYDYPWKLVRAPEAAFAGREPGAGAEASPITVKLFNVEQDPYEKADQAEHHPELVKRLLDLLNRAPRAPYSLSYSGPHTVRAPELQNLPPANSYEIETSSPVAEALPAR